MKVNGINRQSCESIKQFLQQQLENIELDGATIKLVPTKTYTPNRQVKFTLEVNIENADEKEMDEGQLEWAAYAHRFGLPADAHGKTVMLSSGRRGTEAYVITGLSPRAPKYPINVRRVRDGKGYRYGVPGVLRALGVNNVY